MGSEGLKGLRKLVILLLSGLLLSGVIHGGGETKPVIRCVEKERLILLEFKKGLIDKHGILSSWESEEDAKSDCCGWWGIACSNATNHIISLELSGSFEGKLSPSLIELKHLKYLNLGGNNFGGRIPEFLGSFPSLESLILSGAGFNGVIPPQLGNLTNLQRLDLGGNLAGLNSGWLSALSHLTSLHLDQVDLSMNPDWLPEIFNLRLLQELDLRECKLCRPSNSLSFSVVANSSLSFLEALYFGGVHGLNIMSLWPFNMTLNLEHIDLSGSHLSEPINAAIGELQHLVYLDLSYNSVEAASLGCLANLSRLQLLGLSSNELREPLPQLFHQLRGNVHKSLVTLSLDHNELNGTIPDLSRFSSLTGLTLSHNHLDGPFPKSTELPSKLVHLDLSNNSISGPLPSDMAALSFLTDLVINNNKINGSVPQGIGRLSQLQTLDLSSNLLQGEVSEIHFSNLSNLHHLDLSNNSIVLNFSSNWIPPFHELDYISLANCNAGHSFPSWLLTVDYIEELNLSSAGISGPLPEQFWKVATNAYGLDVSNNSISGNLPNSSESDFEDLGFEDLDFLDISSNNFSGTIPSLPPHLGILNLRNNNFNGSIIPLCGMTSRIIHLSDNALSGGIPECLMKNNHLEYLNLENNYFSGEIPNSIGSLNKLMFLSLRNNSFKGELPSSLKNCSSLKIMDVGKNMFTGNIPTWMGIGSNYTMLSLQSNHFNGKIPSSLCQLSNIHILDLSHNKLSGTIPCCFSNFSSLALMDNHFSDVQAHSLFDEFQYVLWNAKDEPLAVFQWKRQEQEFISIFYQKIIDLSSNQLVGEIPPGTVCLKGLRSLNLSRNHLTGNIVWGFGHIEMLESLDLSHNQLSGEIPGDFVYLTKLSVLDLSYNNLSGKIPFSTQLQSFDASSYKGNSFLCGLPLIKLCNDAPPHEHNKDGKNPEEEDNSLVDMGFYVSLVIGFLVGFWGFVIPLFISYSWRVSYFFFLRGIIDWIYVTTVVVAGRTRRYLPHLKH